MNSAEENDRKLCRFSPIYIKITQMSPPTLLPQATAGSHRVQESLKQKQMLSVPKHYEIHVKPDAYMLCESFSENEKIRNFWFSKVRTFYGEKFGGNFNVSQQFFQDQFMKYYGQRNSK